MEQEKLVKEFEKEMLGIYNRAKAEINYTPSEFHNMVVQLGAVETARRLINARLPSAGYTKLWEEKRLDLTVEAVVYENTKWHSLFDKKTLDTAKKRLVEYEYKFKPKSDFFEWMINSGLSNSSSEKYSGAIEGPISDWAREAKIITGSILDIKNQSEMSKAVLSIRKLPIFIQKDETGHHMYSSALKKYSRYLYYISDDDVEGDIRAVISSAGLSETQKTQLVNARIGQGQYRSDLFNLWKGCSVTGYGDKSLLIASHIKPWNVSSNIERLDKFNGLLLLPNLDKAFDRGFISFDVDGKIMISKLLHQRDIIGIESAMFVNVFEQNKIYLEHHRKHVFLDSKQ